MADALQKLMELASKKFNVEKSTLSAKDDLFEKLQINSIQALSLLTDLEREFQIEIPDYELQDVKTFEQLAQLINNRI
ncbi:MAG: acyl carrier protein [Proteobacteria bacterium]|nr:acyl carrier protein [Pseudomonadota bacterium]